MIVDILLDGAIVVVPWLLGAEATTIVNGLVIGVLLIALSHISATDERPLRPGHGTIPPPRARPVGASSDGSIRAR